MCFRLSKDFQGWTGVVVHDFNPEARQVDLCELGASLVYTVRSRQARTS